MSTSDRIPKLKRVPIDWLELACCINDAGYTLAALAEKLGIHRQTLYQAKRDRMINPALLEEMRYYVDLNPKYILTDQNRELMANGHSAGARLSIDWPYFKRAAEDRGYTLSALAAELGKADGYFSTCKSVGGINEDILIEIGRILDLDYRTLVKTTSYDKFTFRNEIVSMVDEIDFTNMGRKAEDDPKE